MARYIDAEELAKRITKYVKAESREEKELVEWCKDECIRQGYCMPTADVAEVKHGYWFDVGSLSCRCSRCGCKNNKESRYCPTCGSKMDAEKGRL